MSIRSTSRLSGERFAGRRSRRKFQRSCADPFPQRNSTANSTSASSRCAPITPRNALNSILPYLAGNGLLVSLQNGINLPLLEQAVDRIVRSARRCGCVASGPRPGHIRTSWRGHLHIGHTHGRTTRQLETVHSLLSPVIPTEITDNILGVLWSKLTYTCCVCSVPWPMIRWETILSSDEPAAMCRIFRSKLLPWAKRQGLVSFP